MGEQRLRALAVRLPAKDAASVRCADRNGCGKVPGGSISQARRFGNDLIECGIDVVGELYFHHRAQAVRAHADRDCDDAAFADRRIETARKPIFLLQAFGGAKDTAEIAYVLAEHEHVRIFGKYHIHRRIEGLDHVHSRHAQTPICWRWRRRCDGRSLYTSSNIVRALAILPAPRVPQLSASRLAARTCSAAFFSACVCSSSLQAPMPTR